MSGAPPDANAKAAEEVARAGAALAQSRITEWWDGFKSERLQGRSLFPPMRGWRDFFDSKKFVPPPAGEVPSRLKSNVAHWQGNYACLFVALLVYCMCVVVFTFFARYFCGPRSADGFFFAFAFASAARGLFSACLQHHQQRDAPCGRGCRDALHVLLQVERGRHAG
jgi:PRA1 family protein